MCSALAERDVCFASDVHFVRDVRLRRVKSGTHHITLRHSRNTSLFAKQTASLAPSAQTSLYNSDLIWYYKQEGGDTVSESKLRDLSMNFSVQIINLVKDLKAKHESVISNQIGRSGTSIGANIYEANYAQGKKDFISKLEIALKEASETGYWLELLHRTGYINDTVFTSLNDQCTSIRVMLVSSCRTAKQNMESN